MSAPTKDRANNMAVAAMDSTKNWLRSIFARWLR
jgi:hypothetical protein